MGKETIKHSGKVSIFCMVSIGTHVYVTVLAWKTPGLSITFSIKL